MATPLRVLRMGRNRSEWIVANKAAGIFSQPATMWLGKEGEQPRVFAKFLLQEYVDTAFLPDAIGYITGKGTVYVVEPLDRLASGCFLAALSAPWASMLRRCVAHPSAARTFVAHVRGRGKTSNVFELNFPLKLGKGPSERALSVMRCLTHIRGLPSAPLRGPPLKTTSSLFLVQPHTRVHHQIRKQFQKLVTNIINDSSYGHSHTNHYWQAKEQYQQLGLHCLAIDIPLPSKDSINEYIKWWEYKSKDVRRGVKMRLAQEEMANRAKNGDNIADTEQAEVDAILSLGTSSERLRAFCPVPEELLSIWKRQEWWTNAVNKVPSLEWTMEDVEARVKNDDLYGTGWPLPCMIPTHVYCDKRYIRRNNLNTQMPFFPCEVEQGPTSAAAAGEDVSTQ